MNMRSVATVAGLALGLMSGVAQAATMVYTDSSVYGAAAGTQTLQNLNSPTAQLATSIVYPDVTFSCSGTSYCPGFFGTSSSHSASGLSVYFATPDTATFTFSAPVYSFGVLIAGLGDVGTTTLSLSNSNGFSAPVFSNYTGTTTSFTDGVLFAGLTSDSSFTSVTFSGTQSDDGIFFDNLTYSTSMSPVPLPASAPMFGAALLGLAGLGYVAKRKKAAAAA